MKNKIFDARMKRANANRAPESQEFQQFKRDLAGLWQQNKMHANQIQRYLETLNKYPDADTFFNNMKFNYNKKGTVIGALNDEGGIYFYFRKIVMDEYGMDSDVASEAVKEQIRNFYQLRPAVMTLKQRLQARFSPALKKRSKSKKSKSVSKKSKSVQRSRVKF